MKAWRSKTVAVVSAVAFALGLSAWLSLPRLERIYWMLRLSNISSAQEESRVFEALRTRTYAFAVLGENGVPLPRALKDEDELRKAKAVDIFLESGGYMLAQPVRDPRNLHLLREY